MNFGLLFHNLGAFNFHTELLEACNWDESEMEDVMKKTISVLDNLGLPSKPCNFSDIVQNHIVPALENENLDKNLINIIIRYIEHNSKFVSHILSLPEN
jgi:hypothetical protein